MSSCFGDATWLVRIEPGPGSGRTARHTLHGIHKKERHRRSPITNNCAWMTEETGTTNVQHRLALLLH